jgi:hypothetical protein
MSEFEDYRRRKQNDFTGRIEDFPKYRYVSSYYDIVGLSSIQGFFIGSYKQRSDIEEIQVHIATIKQRMSIIQSATFVPPTFSTKSLNQPNPTNRHKKDFIVDINGVITNDYELNYILGQSTSWSFTFTQAPPAGSSISISNQYASKQYFTGNGTQKTFEV